MSEPFIGMIAAFAGNFAPKGWALCNGQILSIAQNTALFSILGTTYGGNGIQTFALPNLAGRTIIAPSSTFALGETAGSPTVTILTQNLPAHNHSVNAQAANGSLASPSNALLAQMGAGRDAAQFYSSAPASSPATMNAGMIGNTGGGQPLSVQNPYLVISYIIALVGVFPSRN